MTGNTLLDTLGKWKIVCLSILLVKDVEDVYIVGFLITGFMLFEVGGYLVYCEVQ